MSLHLVASLLRGIYPYACVGSELQCTFCCAGIGEVRFWTGDSHYGAHHPGLHGNVFASWSRPGNTDHGEGDQHYHSALPLIQGRYEDLFYRIHCPAMLRASLDI